ELREPAGESPVAEPREPVRGARVIPDRAREDLGVDLVEARQARGDEAELHDARRMGAPRTPSKLNRSDADSALAEVASRDLHVDTRGLVAGAGGVEGGVEGRAELLAPVDPCAEAAERLDHLLVARVIQAGRDRALRTVELDLAALDLGP